MHLSGKAAGKVGCALPSRPEKPSGFTCYNLSCLSSCLCPGALQIENSEESDQGKYECVATNSAGTRYSAPANLYVRGKSPFSLRVALPPGLELRGFAERECVAPSSCPAHAL